MTDLDYKIEAIEKMIDQIFSDNQIPTGVAYLILFKILNKYKELHDSNVTMSLASRKEHEEFLKYQEEHPEEFEKKEDSDE